VDFQGIDDPKSPLVEVLDMLTVVYGITFDIIERAFKAENVDDVRKFEPANPESIPPRKSPLATVLHKILARVPVRSGAVFLIRSDHVEITTAAAVRRELGLRNLDIKLVWEEFGDVPLDRALKDMAETAGVNVVIDNRIKKQAKAKVTASLYNVPVETAVEALARMAGLAVVMRDNVLFVTSPRNARHLLKSKRWFAEPRRQPKPTPTAPPGTSEAPEPPASK
jgi:hypothetical protein